MLSCLPIADDEWAFPDVAERPARYLPLTGTDQRVAGSP